MVRVFIVDAILLYREGLARLLQKEANIFVAGTAASLAEARDAIGASQPEVLLIRFLRPDQITAVRPITEAVAPVKVIALGVPETEEDVITCAEAGMAGYVPRDGTLDDLVTIIHAVARGEMPCSPHIAASLFRKVAALVADRHNQMTSVRLTPREREIVHLIDEGLSNKEIAQRLCIDVHTIKNHVHNVLEKLGVQRRGEAAARVRMVRAGLEVVRGQRSGM